MSVAKIMMCSGLVLKKRSAKSASEALENFWKSRGRSRKTQG